MGSLKNNMIVAMKTHGYSDKTIKLYTSGVRALAVHYNRTPLDITKREIESFLYYLRTERKSESTIHVYFEAIKFFYRMHNLADRLPDITIKKGRGKLPVLLSQDQVYALLEKCDSLKYKTVFALIYSAGLRVSEAANLRMRDIDFSRKTIFIRNGKNGKDRYTLLANETMGLLRDYYGVYHPSDFVFYGNDVLCRISIDCIQRRFKKLVLDNAMDKSIHIHTLRHCFATHLLENGTSIFYIMRLLGHSSIQTTLVYLRMAALEELSLESPIDSYRRRLAEGFPVGRDDGKAMGVYVQDAIIERHIPVLSLGYD